MKKINILYVYLSMVFIVMASCSAGPDGQGHTGGGRDEHGCIGSAGYIWCESKQRCIRPWLEDCKSLNPIQAKYNCDDLGDVKVEYRRSTAVLFTPDGEKFELERAVSASGARYAGEDAEIWDKAGSATLRIGSDEFSCIAKDN